MITRVKFDRISTEIWEITCEDEDQLYEIIDDLELHDSTFGAEEAKLVDGNDTVSWEIVT